MKRHRRTVKWKSKSLCDKLFDVKFELFGGWRVLSFATSELDSPVSNITRSCLALSVAKLTTEKILQFWRREY